MTDAASRTRWPRALVTTGALLLTAAALPGHAAAANPTTPSVARSNVTPALSALAVKRPEGSVEVIVQFAGFESASHRAAVVRAAGGAPGRDLELIEAVEARMSAVQAVRLAGQPHVRAVTLNGQVEQTGDSEDSEDSEDSKGSKGSKGSEGSEGSEDSEGSQGSRLATAYNQSIGSTTLWNADSAATGNGVGVAVIDTGIAGEMADFRRSADDLSSRVVASALVHPDAQGPGDAVGHGTHVAGIIAGNGANRSEGDPLNGRYVGVAPQANLINVKASDDQGNTTVADVINGLQFVVDKRRDYNIRVANLSLTSTVAQSYKIDPLAAAAEQAWFAGILVVAASGNSGPDSVKFAPGNDPYVLSVGGGDDRGTTNPADDVIASWTSTGTTQDGFRKPEVMAPGARLVSALAPGSAYGAQCPSCVVDGTYLRLGGTSMAAAVVSGAGALLAQAHPTWTPDGIKSALVNKARDVPGTGKVIAVDAARGASLRDRRPATRPAPNTLIDTSTGRVDPARARWGGFEWHTATDSLRARWGGASFVCSCMKTIDTAGTDPLRARWGGADPTRARWGSTDSARARWGSVGWATSFAR